MQTTKTKNKNKKREKKKKKKGGLGGWGVHTSKDPVVLYGGLWKEKNPTYILKKKNKNKKKKSALCLSMFFSSSGK